MQMGAITLLSQKNEPDTRGFMIIPILTPRKGISCNMICTTFVNNLDIKSLRYQGLIGIGEMLQEP